MSGEHVDFEASSEHVDFEASSEHVDFEASSEITLEDNKITEVDWVATDLELTHGDGRFMPNSIPAGSPIENVICRAASGDVVQDRQRPDSSRYNGHTPLWISASIDRSHIRTPAECAAQRNNTQNRWLARIIHYRGGYREGKTHAEYDASHILALVLGGDYIEWNLFPQKPSLNQGRGGTRAYWYEIERIIQAYVSRDRHRVELQVRLFYDNDALPDLPTRIMFSVRFLRNRDQSRDDDDEVLCQAMRTLLNTAVIADQLADLEECREFNDTARRLTQVETLAEVVALCRRLNALWARMQERLRPRPTSQPSPPNPTPKLVPVRDRSLSVWDFVPVVSSIRTIKESCEDFSDGNKLSGSIKMGFGVLSAISDATLIGGISSAVGKGVLKAAGMSAAKEVAKTSGKAVGGEILKSASISAAEAATFSAVKVGANPLAKKAAEKVALEVTETVALNVASHALTTVGSKLADKIEEEDKKKSKK